MLTKDIFNYKIVKKVLIFVLFLLEGEARAPSPPPPPAWIRHGVLLNLSECSHFISFVTLCVLMIYIVHIAQPKNKLGSNVPYTCVTDIRGGGSKEQLWITAKPFIQ